MLETANTVHLNKMYHKTTKQFFIENVIILHPTKLEGGYHTGITLSICLAVRPSIRLSVGGMVSGA